MVKRMVRYTKGYVKIRIEGYSPERFLNLCSHHNIYLWGLTPREHAYELYMNLDGFRKLRPLVRKTHIRIQLVRRYGFPFFVSKYKNRSVFFIGFFLCVALLFLYSSFIWDIHFEGNEKWTNEALVEFLKTKNVSPCMKKSQIDCAKIVRDIREEYNDIVWVSASIEGSRLKIQIKENEDLFQEIQKEDSPNDLVASSSGVITQIVTRAGVPQVHVGDTVEKGQLLVSGRVEVQNDAGEVIGYQYQQADADIYANTQIVYEDSVSCSYHEKSYENSKRKQFFIQIGKWKVRLGMLKNSYQEYEVHTKEKRVKLGENFSLPISYGWITIQPYVSEKKNYTTEALKKQLRENFEYFSKELMEKGIQIYKNDVKIHVSEKSAVAKGTLFLNQRITQKADTEIIEVERKSEDESFRTDD